MLDLRLRAWEEYERLPMPKPTDETWRRTNLRGIDPAAFSAFDHNGSSGAAAASSLLPADAFAGSLLHVDWHSRDRVLDRKLEEKGVILCDLRTGLRDHADLVQQYFLRDAPETSLAKFESLHTALWSSGALVYVPDGVEVELPLHSLTGMSAAGIATFAHTPRGSRIEFEAGAGRRSRVRHRRSDGHEQLDDRSIPPCGRPARLSGDSELGHAPRRLQFLAGRGGARRCAELRGSRSGRRPHQNRRAGDFPRSGLGSRALGTLHLQRPSAHRPRNPPAPHRRSHPEQPDVQRGVAGPRAVGLSRNDHGRRNCRPEPPLTRPTTIS